MCNWKELYSDVFQWELSNYVSLDLFIWRFVQIFYFSIDFLHIFGLLSSYNEIFKSLHCLFYQICLIMLYVILFEFLTFISFLLFSFSPHFNPKFLLNCKLWNENLPINMFTTVSLCHEECSPSYSRIRFILVLIIVSF